MRVSKQQLILPAYVQIIEVIFLCRGPLIGCSPVRADSVQTLKGSVCPDVIASSLSFTLINKLCCKKIEQN